MNNMEKLYFAYKDAGRKPNTPENYSAYKAAKAAFEEELYKRYLDGEIFSANADELQVRIDSATNNPGDVFGSDEYERKNKAMLLNDLQYRRFEALVSAFEEAQAHCSAKEEKPCD